jgi:hypothetical protein
LLGQSGVLQLGQLASWSSIDWSVMGT